jgi:hypothetical protein
LPAISKDDLKKKPRETLHQMTERSLKIMSKDKEFLESGRSGIWGDHVQRTQFFIK